MLPNFCTSDGSNVAPKPNPSGQSDMAPPAPALNSDFIFPVTWSECQGSELVFTGIPNPNPSTYACI